MTKKDKRRVAANKAKKKYQMVTKKTRANGTVSVSGPQLKLFIYNIRWASTTIKIMVDPISMIKTLIRQSMVVILILIIALMVVGIPGYLCNHDSHFPKIFKISKP